MTKIKFNCPSCNAKLKVPASLAGVSGPCPKCGGTIVAPLQSEEDSEPQKAAAVVSAASAQHSGSSGNAGLAVASAPAAATAVAEQPRIVVEQKPQVSPPVINQPVVAPPVVAQQPVVASPPVPQQIVIEQPVVQAPPINQQPIHQAAPVAPPQTVAAVSNEVGFPRPLEQVSHTAAVALANAPVGFAQQPAPPQNFPAPAPVAQAPVEPAPQPQAYEAPQPQQPVYQQPQPQAYEQPQPAEDIFAEQPVQQQPAPVQPSPEPQPQQETFQDPPTGGYENAYVPQTQPIQVKTRQDEHLAQDVDQGHSMPRLDVSLGQAGGDTLSAEQSAYQAEPTVIQLPEVGTEANEENFAVHEAERPAYRPPNPVALTPPGEEMIQDEGYLQPTPEFEEPAAVAEVENVQPEYDYQVEPEFPLEESAAAPVAPQEEYHPQSFEEPVGLPDAGEGSVAAFLAEAMEGSSSVDGDGAKSKDEILDELLGVVPQGKQKKKGLSASTKFMLSVLAAVVVCAAIGVYYAFDKLGGFSMAGETVHGEDGLRNLEKKTGIDIKGITGRKTTIEEKESAAAVALPPTIEAPKPDVPEKIDIPLLDQVKEQTTDLVAKVEDRVQAIIEAPVEEPPIPEAQELANENTIKLVPSPSPLPEVKKKNYSPKAFYPAPGPDDAPLMNTHDLITAYMRAPNWEARLPYTYRGDSLRPAIADYYSKWPDFSFDRFKMKLFQMETEEEYGGPFWVYQIFKSDADSGGVPMIIRVEDGNLKVDWQVYSEFSDEHFLKFREGTIPAPHSFRLVAERVSSYPGPDKPGFTDLDNYLCYQLNPPYGGYQAYSEYAFVKKGTAIAKLMDEKIALADDPLAVILTLELQPFSHGVRHYVITEFVDEGWFN